MGTIHGGYCLDANGDEDDSEDDGFEEGPIGIGDGDEWSDHDIHAYGYITAIELNIGYYDGASGLYLLKCP